MAVSIARSAGVFALFFVLLSCSKAGDAPRQVRASRTVPPAPSGDGSPIASTSSSNSGQAAEQPVPASSGLATVTAEQLRARIRATNAKGTLVNAWASWCGPCRAELPMLDAMTKNLAQQGIELVLVSVDEPEDRAKAEAFLKSFEIRSPAYLAARPLGPFKQGMNPRWPGMLPATFLFDASGKLRYFWGGPVEEHEILTIVEGFLAGKAIDGEADFTLAPGQVEH